ncbi:hypothetical protein HNP60_001681 [Sphingobium sp. B1D3A]|uniref:Uncharacterized protein n=1 Tax=Sphingobium lignivorans TaxID=2735886 RepID=A0ABR6NEJ7_9SPHN|nr:hypothetical protein [Sphingobium lignivorans]
MKKIFWILVLGAIGSAAMAVGLGNAKPEVGTPR